MNILVIPSWYPSEANSIAGIFFQEQVEALAKFYPKISFIVIKPLIRASFRNNLKHRPFRSDVSFIKTNNIKHVTIRYDAVIPEKWESTNFFLKMKLSYEAYLISKALNKQEKINLIHAHVSYPGGYMAMLLAKKLKIPYIITEHMSPFPFEIYPYYKNGNISEFVAKPIKNASKVVAVSKSLASRIANFGLPFPMVIPNMVNEDVFYSVNENIKQKTTNEFVFFALGVLSSQKGFDVLIKAIAIVAAKNKNVKLVIGGGGNKVKYEELINKLSLEGYIKFIGAVNRDKVVTYMNECDCFVLSSRHETFACVVAEAIACGKPVIATKCGGPEDIVNKINGLFCDVDNVADLADKMISMMYSRKAYESKKIREDFMNRFSRKVVAEKTVNLYHEISKKSNYGIQ